MNELKKMFLGLTTSAVVFTNFAALPSRAQEGPPEGGPEQTVEVHETPDADCPEECRPWAEKMGLSDEQMEKLVSLKSDYEVKTAEQKAELMADMKKMMLLMTAPELDKSAILALHEKMSSIKSDLSTARVHHMISVMEVMTSKQRSNIRHHMLVHMSIPHHMEGWHHMKHHHE